MKIYIVEDEEIHSNKLIDFIHEFKKQNSLDVDFDIDVFKSPIDFFNGYKNDANIVFFDIQMPGMNGMEGAKKLRAKDENVVIFFITSFAQYALQGYEVGAVDYALKPLTYSEFSMKFRRALKRIKIETDDSIKVKVNKSFEIIPISSILYIESVQHRITIHLIDGEITTRETLTTIENKLNGKPFSRCNNCYLVNLSKVSKVDKLSVYIGKEELQISRPRKKEFQQAFLDFVDGK